MDYPEPFRRLASELRRLPGIGSRSAERISLWLVGAADARPVELAAAIGIACDTLQVCTTCGFFAVADTCEICADAPRRNAEICVVERATDILPIERTGSFRGLYHVLGGRLSPLNHIGPENLTIDKLVTRIQTEQPTEIILALNADVEGEATTNYIAEIITPLGVTITRIAHGLPVGGGLEHADPLTLTRAFSGRRTI